MAMLSRLRGGLVVGVDVRPAGIDQRARSDLEPATGQRVGHRGDPNAIRVAGRVGGLGVVRRDRPRNPARRAQTGR
ncbi:MAG: hypothetical protein MZV70_71580 [Desulfobacterales bacterium]|nr:hypothetical protein [Desulfobacterales bacterium]